MDVGYLFCSVSYNLVLSLFILWLKLFQLKPLGTPLAWLFCSINKPLACFEHSLIFWHHKMFLALPELSLPQTCSRWVTFTWE